MPWWKPSSSSSSPSSQAPKCSSSADASPSNTRPRELAFIWRNPGDSPRRQYTRYSRQRNFRPLADFDAARSTRSSTIPESLPSRSSSSPVLHPHHLPLPLSNNGLQDVAVAAACSGGCEACCRPSLKAMKAGGGMVIDERDGGHVHSDSAAAVGTDLNEERFWAASGSRSAFPNTLKSPDYFDIPPKRYTFSNHRRAIHDPNSVESINFRLNIPAKSAPPSGFSTPVLSPGRLSNADVFPSTFNTLQGLHAWSAPEVPSTNIMAGMSPQTSPAKLHSSLDFSPLCSPPIRSPIPKLRNPSAPQSPLHPKLYSENSGPWHDSSVNLNLHPLPLPPGPAVHPQSSSSHPNAMKNEEASMASQWQKQKLIGSGTFGNVYMATNKHTGALCAMKEVNIIPDDPKSAECLQQLEQEIKVLSKLKHRNIVQYYGSELTEDRLFIYLEYVYPGSIDKYVHEHCGAMTESVVRNFTRHILNGLAYLHTTKNIHRDIKGANLLVDVNGTVKLADFGMAKHLSGAAAALSLKGTPYWMAPEVVQATMNKDIGYDFAVDIWSLGCTIIEMFSGKHPWSGLEGAAAMFKVLHKDPPIPEGLSCEGKDFLRRCFHRNPAERPTASVLLDHPFVRSVQAFAGIKLTDTTNNQNDNPRARTEPVMKGRRSPNRELSHQHDENFEPASCLHSLYLRSNHSSPDLSASSMNPSSAGHPFAAKHLGRAAEMNPNFSRYPMRNI
ncbi:Mitogen-activated protein kinase kinase kinase YODA [Platanthera zijinensis]|uniref:mitogen-activated protein kinase kinase kinase n=1 Tax=Platanthera zijinensis TaxID=2320716 RepID=A0AAP0C1L6_9ASPA